MREVDPFDLDSLVAMLLACNDTDPASWHIKEIRDEYLDRRVRSPIRWRRRNSDVQRVLPSAHHRGSPGAWLHVEVEDDRRLAKTFTVRVRSFAFDDVKQVVVHRRLL